MCIRNKTTEACIDVSKQIEYNFPELKANFPKRDTDLRTDFESEFRLDTPPKWLREYYNHKTSAFQK